MTKDNAGSGDGAGERGVYKAGARARDTMNRATRNMTDLVVGVSKAMADGARTFSDTVAERAKDTAARPTDFIEAGALTASRVFSSLAESWQAFYESLVRDHKAMAATPESIDYEKLADLIAARMKAADKPGPDHK
jgi:hypothetical protein